MSKIRVGEGRLYHYDIICVGQSGELAAVDGDSVSLPVAVVEDEM